MNVFVYILKCSDNSYYVGHTSDVDNRIEIHNSGKGPTYTANRRPVKLMYKKEHDSINSAVKRETQIKKWTRAKKNALINGDLNKLKDLAKSKET